MILLTSPHQLSSYLIFIFLLHLKLLDNPINYSTILDYLIGQTRNVYFLKKSLLAIFDEINVFPSYILDKLILYDYILNQHTLNSLLSRNEVLRQDIGHI